MPLEPSSLQPDEYIQQWLYDISQDGADLSDQGRYDGQARKHRHQARAAGTGLAGGSSESIAQIGSSPPEPQDRTSLRIKQRAKDEKVRGHSVGDIQRHISTSNRRRHTSKRKRDSEHTKRPRVTDDRSYAPINPTAPCSSSGSDRDSSHHHPSITDGLERRDVRKDQYERRPRHKTKADKYELKKSSKSRDCGLTAISKKRSSKQRRRESGIALNTDFKAPNVAQDRLTLKANSGPGMFQNGKASSKIQRRGLPDLSFSEMNFLRQPISHPDPLQGTSKEKRSKSTKREKERTEQISEYFDRAPPREPHLRHLDEAIVRRQSTVVNQAAPQTRSSSSSDNLRARQRALANEGWAHHLPPTQARDLPVTKEDFVSDVEESSSEHYKPSPLTLTCRGQADHSTSQHNWSVTPSQRSEDLKEADSKSNGESPKIARSKTQSLNKQQPLANEKPAAMVCQDRNACEAADESSISQLSLDQYTKSMLLGSKHDVWNHIPPQGTTTEFYTLTDLKHLSRLEKLDVNPTERYVSLDEHGPQISPSRTPLPNSGYAQVDGHQSRTCTGQEIFQNQHIASNHDQDLSMPGISLPLVTEETINFPVQNVFNSLESTDSPLPHGKLNHSRWHADGSAQALPRLTFMSTENRRFFSPPTSRHALYPSAREDTAAVRKPTRPGNHSNAYAEPNIHSRAALDTAHQIIHDIEQEERLANWISHHEAAKVAVGGSTDQPRRLRDCDVLLSEQEGSTSLNQDAFPVPDQDPRQDDRGAAQDPPADRTFFDRDIYSAEAGAEHTATWLQNRKFHRLVSERCSPGGLQMSKPGVEEEAELVDFWRPHVLY